jgi:hypothetical protein
MHNDIDGFLSQIHVPGASGPDPGAIHVEYDDVADAVFELNLVDQAVQICKSTPIGRGQQRIKGIKR